MSRRYQCVLFATGLVVIALAVALAVVGAMLVYSAGTLDFWPAVAFLGMVLVAVAGIAKMKDKSTASLVALVVRLLNTGFTFCCVVFVFVWLPVNNRSTDVLWSVVANGSLIAVAASYWWFIHRALRLAVKNIEA